MFLLSNKKTNWNYAILSGGLNAWIKRTLSKEIKVNVMLKETAFDLSQCTDILR